MTGDQLASTLEKLINIRGGESGGSGEGRAFMVARCGSPGHRGSSMNGQVPPPTGDHKGPPPVHPTALAPTDSWVAVTAARLVAQNAVRLDQYIQPRDESGGCLLPAQEYGRSSLLHDSMRKWE